MMHFSRKREFERREGKRRRVAVMDKPFRKAETLPIDDEC